MSQLVFQSTAGGSITFTGAVTSGSFNVAVPASNGTLVYQDASNNFTVANLIVSGNSTFAGFTCSADGLFSGTGQIQLPAGTIGQRSSSPVNGMIRYNITNKNFEGYANNSWGQLGSGATGAGGDQVFVQNGNTVTTSYTLTTGFNAESVGPITISSGAIVTVPSGQRWLVL
jgi:hypothetical protein